ncbi:MAG: hypothetical protein WCQ64_06080, partial [Acidobacteriota bacterium]
AYTPIEFLGDVRKGIWAELATPAKPIDVFRRNVQRAYLDAMDARLNGGAEPSDEVRALLKGELKALNGQVSAAIAATTDTATRRHLEDARDQIAITLDPKAQRARAGAAGAAGAGRGFGAGPLGGSKYPFNEDPFLQAPTTCWPDLTIIK